jgi:hypothetical protein
LFIVFFKDPGSTNLTHSVNFTFIEPIGDSGSTNLSHSVNFTFIEALGDPGSTNLTNTVNFTFIEPLCDPGSSLEDGEDLVHEEQLEDLAGALRYPAARHLCMHVNHRLVT